MNAFKKIILVIRPKTLFLSCSPILLGHALALSHFFQFDELIFITALFTSILLQIAVNIHNDYSDFLKGADTKERIGPLRLAQSGLFKVEQLQKLFYFFITFIILVGSYLIYRGGWIIFVCGLLSILACYAYTGGKKPIAYTPFGEMVVLLFFGVIAVNCSYFLQSKSFNIDVFIFSIALGLMAANVLTMNNYRDIETDQKIKKNTLAVKLGRKKTTLWICISYIISFHLLLLVDISFYYLYHTLFLFTIFALFLCYQLKKTPINEKLNKFIGIAVLLQFIFSLIFSFILIYF